jgi:cyclophilin family peptidyl-prolyl cis-trans isomerase
MEVIVLSNQKPTRVQLETSLGNILIELDAEKAPVTVENFLKYVSEGFFDGKDNQSPTIFHRVIPGFMVQGGGFTPKMTQKETHDQIKIESDNGLKNNRGTLAMARTNDPNSATSQFFINVADNSFLNHKGPSNPGYAVFGHVAEGMEIVDKIVAVKTKTFGPYENVPIEPVTILSAQVI